MLKFTTTVININNAPIGWEKNNNYVYIGRSGKGFNGYFGNPFRRNLNDSIGSTLNKYEQYLKNRINNDLEFRNNVKNLNGKTLVCFCKTKKCHGYILIKYVEILNG